jgi:hypothetical protein
MGSKKAEHAFINIEIVERLHYTDLTIVDVTGLRSNCFMELGYALGLGNSVIVMAQEGTALPFDQSAIPTHFWSPKSSTDGNRRLLLEFIEKNVDRAPIVVRQIG